MEEQGHRVLEEEASLMQILASSKLASQKRISSLSLADGLTQGGSTCR